MKGPFLSLLFRNICRGFVRCAHSPLRRLGWYILRLMKSPRMRTPCKSRTWIWVGIFHHKEPNQLSYTHFAIILDIKTTIIFKLHFWSTPMPFKSVEPLFLTVRSILYKEKQVCIHGTSHFKNIIVQLYFIVIVFMLGCVEPLTHST